MSRHDPQLDSIAKHLAEEEPELAKALSEGRLRNPLTDRRRQLAILRATAFGLVIFGILGGITSLIVLGAIVFAGSTIALWRRTRTARAINSENSSGGAGEHAS